MLKASTWIEKQPLACLLVAACGTVVAVVAGILLSLGTLSLVASVAGLLTCGFIVGKMRSDPAPPSAQTFEAQVASALQTTVPARRTEELVDEMLDQGRYLVALDRRIVDRLTPSQLRRARALLEDCMAEIPAGDLWQGVAADDLLQAELAADHPAFSAPLFMVPACRIDRRPVTNQEFQSFVAVGGYRQTALWDPQVWGAMAGFVDQTGCPGPRYWRNGQYPAGCGNHPVVGVSWYEAAAYARWVGKRLPRDPEWEKAASAPVPLAEGAPMQRRYPWGDEFIPERCNLWSSQRRGVVNVTEFADGNSPEGVQQLVGNVWEWTSDDFEQPELILPFAMKSIRGGAFDTYFECQATSQFRSGELPIQRKHNIGFRCAADLDPSEPSTADEFLRTADAASSPHEAIQP